MSSRSAILIGDLQGCFDALDALLEKFAAFEGAPVDPARLVFLGDLVNRGPQSLETLRWVKQSGARTVLGNHDLHLLAVAAGIRPAHSTDTLESILRAIDREELVDWLRRQPLAMQVDGHLIVHAGLFPQWDRPKALALADEVHAMLCAPDWAMHLRQMYGNQPDTWSDDLRDSERLRAVINGFTRMRFCTPQGQMEFTTKEGAGAAPQGFHPWFELPHAKWRDTPVAFGHWSTLGLIVRPDLLALDTGCVWGGALTGVRLEDHVVLQVSCPQAATPKPG
jgi:bis(5'-nucleosyl)-tetraphosphatase (symmetrical)